MKQITYEPKIEKLIYLVDSSERIPGDPWIWLVNMNTTELHLKWTIEKH